MNEHPTSLELDEVIAGYAAAGVAEHVRSCPACHARVAPLTAERDQALAQAGFARGQQRLRGSLRTPRRQWIVPAAVAASLALVAVGLSLRSPMLRARGGASLALVDAAGAETRTPRPGETVVLRASPGAHRYALIGVVEAGGAPVVIWPERGSASGAVAGTVEIRLAVSEGAARVVALFSDRPLDAAALREPPPDAEVRSLQVEPRR